MSEYRTVPNDRIAEMASWNAFVTELAKQGNEDLYDVFCSAMEERIYKVAVAAGRSPTTGIGQWAGGVISVCDELLEGAKAALAKRKSDAKDGSFGEFPPDLT